MKTTGILIRLSKLFTLLFLILIISSCEKDKEEEIIATDYSISDHWLSIPTSDKPIDVFYLYPTSWKKIDST